MIELIPDLPDNVVGVVATGQVSARDYEDVLVPAVEAALERHGRVRLLYHVGPSFTGFSPGAMWDDLKLGVGHFTAWERIAVVTDVDWLAGAVKLFGFAMPCPVKVFDNREMSDALRWVAAD